MAGSVLQQGASCHKPKFVGYIAL